jgi:hypothetical protein
MKGIRIMEKMIRRFSLVALFAMSCGGGDEGEATCVDVTPADSGAALCPLPTAPTATPIQFNDNGGWCWMQDERAVVDTIGNKLVIGSVASGGTRDGYIEAVVYDLVAGTKQVHTLGTGLAALVDDHNAPAFVVRPDGKYLALWSSHRTDCYTRFSIFDGVAWSGESLFDWTPLGCPWAGAATNMITYANPWYLGDSIYAAFRSVNSGPAFITSADGGENWNYTGRLTATKQFGYVAGYYKYWGNNTDRIDFVGTEAHPRDSDNNMWHGYVQDGKVYNSIGTVIDSSLMDPSTSSTHAKGINAFTRLFKTGSAFNTPHGCVVLNHAWNHDMVRYADGTIAVTAQARVKGTGSDDPDKRLLYFRFDGTSWKGTYLAKAGSKLYQSEQDYTGLSAVHPDDPNTIFISTTFDPRDDMTQTPKHEIYQGTTCDNGATWNWTPITQDSTVDNIRPIVPKWDANHTVLVWMKGTYVTAQSYTMEIVGLIWDK